MRNVRRLCALLIAVAMAVAVAACDGGGDGDDEGPPTTPGAEGTFIPTPDPVTYPTTITDMLGRSVRIAERPERIAALSPTTVEFVYALGASTVTRSSETDYPPEALAAADIGPASSPDLERVIQQNPDIIIADSVTQVALSEQLEATDVPVVFAGARSFAEVLTAWEVIGHAIDKRAEATEGAARTLNTLTVVTTRLPGYQPAVLALYGTPDDLLASTDATYIGDLLRLLSAHNVASGQPPEGSPPGFARVPVEYFWSNLPNVILVIGATPEDGEAIVDFVTTDPDWLILHTVQGRVHALDRAIYLDAPGPRATLAVDELSKLLFPEVFGP